MVWDIALGIILAVVLLPLVVVGIAIAVLALVGLARVTLIVVGVLLALSVPAGVATVLWLLGFCDAGSETMCVAQVGEWLGPVGFIAWPLMYAGIFSLILIGVGAAGFAGTMYDKYYVQRLAENDWASHWLLPLCLFLALELFIVWNFEADRDGRELMGALFLVGAITTVCACVIQFNIWARDKSWWVQKLPWVAGALSLTAFLAFISPLVGLIALVVFAALFATWGAYDRGRAERLAGQGREESGR
jgi:hypothetical protein